MDYSAILENLRSTSETDPDAEFSISQALSLPIDFLLSFVRNRKEIELLLTVSNSAATLDSLMKNYEIIALRAQELQEAWDMLWLAHEPYVVPAIPIIGCEMSGINRGRSILLQKIKKESAKLQEIGKQLHHYIGVNYSLVEELHMEGIDRLATNKLLLVEIEKELARRIDLICSTGRVKDLSSIKQFLGHLSRKPCPMLLMSDVPSQSNCQVNNETDGSSKDQHTTETTANEDIDGMSPESQSIHYMCAPTGGDGMHLSLHAGKGGMQLSAHAGYRDLPLPNNVLCYQGWFPDRSTSSSKELHAVGGSPEKCDIVPDARNHSSSASEERLPSKSFDKGLCQNILSHENIDIAKKKEKSEYGIYQIGEEQNVVSSGLGPKNMPTNWGDGIYYKNVEHIDNTTDKECKLEVVPFTGCSKVDLSHGHGQLDFQEHSVCGALTRNVLHSQALMGQSVATPLEGDMAIRSGDNQVLHVLKGDTKKRASENTDSVDEPMRENMDMLERSTKRILVNAISEIESPAAFPRRDVLKVKKRLDDGKVKHSKETMHGQRDNSLSASYDKQDEMEQIDNYTDSKKGISLICSSCGPQAGDDFTNSLSAMESTPFTQAKCRDCGCSLSQTFDQQGRDILEKTFSLNLDCLKGNELAEPFGIQTSESPILATQ